MKFIPISIIADSCFTNRENFEARLISKKTRKEQKERQESFSIAS
jgi:hypothetical protein